MGSKPLVAETMMVSRRTGTLASVAAKNSEGTTITMTSAPSTAAAMSPVASMPSGRSKSGMYTGFRRRAGGHALAAAEAEEHRPAVADDRGHRADGQRTRRAAAHPARDADGEVALHDVAEQRGDRGQTARRAQDVGGADGAAAVAAD